MKTYIIVSSCSNCYRVVTTRLSEEGFNVVRKMADKPWTLYHLCYRCWKP